VESVTTRVPTSCTSTRARSGRGTENRA
jgi:hypothetical protein